MAYNTYTTDEMVDDILLLAHAPTGNNTFTSTEVLSLANKELQTTVMKQILSTRGGYYKTYEDLENLASGLYPIPGAAIAGAIDDVQLVQNTSIVPVNPIEPSEQLSTNAPMATSYGFFPQGNYIQILPIPNVGTPRFWYSKRVSKMVLTTACAQVTAINGADIDVSSLPDTMLVGTEVDALGENPPFNVLSEREITAINGTTVTLDAEVTGLQIGDWLALHGQTCIPQLPVEFRIVLEQKVVCKIYELQGYLDKLEKAKESYEQYREDTLTLISPRVRAKTKIINAQLGGFLGKGRTGFNYIAGRES